MKQYLPIIYIIVFLQIYSKTTAQYCGIKDPSLERYSSCPTTHSQLYTKSYHWFNVLNPSVSTSDYYHEGHACNFGGFIAAGGIHVSYCSSCFRNACSNTYYQGCGRAGIFVNYNDGSQDPKYKEFIGTRVDLVSGRNYTISIDIQRSNDPSTNTIERDLAIYGYNGALPAAQVGFCPSGAIPIDTISKNLFNNDTNNTILSNFICPTNFNYLIIGPVCDGLDATNIGYVYLDKILLSDSRDSTLTPWIKFAGKDSKACCFSGLKNEFQLVGNKAPVGTTVLWSQKTSNPQALTFTSPTDSFTNITGTGYLTIGAYDFYYSWTKNGCTMIDTVTVNVLNNPRANAGSDIVICNGSNLVMNAISPTMTEISSRGYLAWWSMVDTSKPNGIYTFPLINPLEQACNSGPEPLTQTVGYTINGTNIPYTIFNSLHQADTFQFIWNIVDDCNTYSSDTVKTYNYQFKFEYDSSVICPGDTSGFIAETQDSIYNSRHVNRIPLYYTWTILNDTNTAQLVGNIHSDRIRLTSHVPGLYTILVDVYDSTNSLCSHYSGSMDIYVKDTTKILHPSDIVICGESEIRIVQGGVPISTEWWWDVVDYSEPDSLFTLFNPDFPYLPFDGDSNINTRFPTSFDSATSTPNLFYTIFIFPYILPQDTFTLIYNVRNSCFPFNIKKDTINVITNHVSISAGPPINCPGDTTITLFEAEFSIRLNDPNDTSLHYYWHQTSGIGIIHFDSLSTRDSINCTVQNIPGPYEVELILYDSDDLLCPSMSTSINFNILSPVILDSLYAGPDIKICNSQLIPYSLIMNANPSISTLNAYGYESWWSLIDYSEPDSEYTFDNGCEPGDGFDNGNITCGFDLTCGVVTPFSSDAPNCFFVIDNWGCYDFIWHIRYECNGVGFYKDDTMRFCWDFLEPTANAGLNDTATCNVYQLIGNTSAASAANDGCFLWRQINSSTGIHIQIADSTNNIAYLLGLDTIATGTYTFEYTIGCGTCSKKDTVSIYIPGSLPTPTIHLTTNVTDIYLCKGDSVKVTATGADQYQFFVNGLSVSILSSLNNFTNKIWDYDTNYITVIAYDADLGCFSSADTSLIFILHNLDSLKIDSDSLLFCMGSNAYLVGNTPYNSQRIFWFSEVDNFNTPINLPNGTPVGDSFSVSPSIPTIYKATIFDTQTGCWSYDTLSLKVIPIVAALPNPILQNDTSICSYDDSLLYLLHVTNHLYSGIWNVFTNSNVQIIDINNPNTSVIIDTGTHLFTWTENNLGCTNSDSFVLKLIPYPIVFAGVDTIICKGKQITLNGNGNALNYTWVPNDSVIDASDLNTKTIKLYSNILFTLLGQNDICSTTDSIELKVIDCPSDIKAPSAFSPNGDGINDYFTVFTYKMKSYEIWIFNRWGEKVYYSGNVNETNDLNSGWDGKYNGSIQDIGVYVYYIKAKNNDDETVELKGNITLIK